jgi:hypothetical protein
VDECVSRGATLDLAQADQVPALEVPVAVLELPQRSIRGRRVKDVAHCSTAVSTCVVVCDATARDVPLWKPYMFSCRTKEEMLVCLKYDLWCVRCIRKKRCHSSAYTYDKTLENSLEGDMTKLSFVLAQEMRCWMLWSSSMLLSCQWSHSI